MYVILLHGMCTEKDFFAQIFIMCIIYAISNINAYEMLWNHIYTQITGKGNPTLSYWSFVEVLNY